MMAPEATKKIRNQSERGTSSFKGDLKMLHKKIGTTVVLGAGLLLSGCGQNAVTSQTAQAPAQASLPSRVSFEIEGRGKGLNALKIGDVAALPTLAGNTQSIGARIAGKIVTEDTPYIRHFAGLINISPYVNDPVAVQDASWKVVVGLAGGKDNTCFSFESYNYPGEYMRHKYSRVVRNAPDGSPTFNEDATWCSRVSLDGATDAGSRSAFSYESFNFPGRFLRHYGGEVWLARKGGPLPSDNPNLFESDASWDFYTPF
ncbi:AbfB domain-containing protein [Deinococcus sp.]|uniref:AbfB domain-containing protein n=1 Tax=Deinococcus sp. TaxID=47478 RepID=UPI003B5BF399